MKCVWFFIIFKKCMVIEFVRSFVALSLQRRQPHFRLSPSTLEILNAFEIVFPCLYFLQTMCWISVSALPVSTLTRSEPRMFGSSRFQIFWRNSTNCALLRCCNLGQTKERITLKIHAYIDILEEYDFWRILWHCPEPISCLCTHLRWQWTDLESQERSQGSSLACLDLLVFYLR